MGLPTAEVAELYGASEVGSTLMGLSAVEGAEKDDTWGVGSTKMGLPTTETAELYGASGVGYITSVEELDASELE
jgi:hypothetical protein